MIRPEIMRMVLQETSIRPKIKIMLQAGYTYDTIQATLGCSPKTISAVKKLLDSNEMVLYFYIMINYIFNKLNFILFI